MKGGAAGDGRGDGAPGARRRRAGAEPLTADALESEIGRYDAADAERASHRRREVAGLETATAEVVALYREVIEEHGRRGPADPAEEGAAAAAYLEQWGPRLGDRIAWAKGTWSRRGGGWRAWMADLGRGLRRRLRSSVRR